MSTQRTFRVRRVPHPVFIQMSGARLLCFNGNCRPNSPEAGLPTTGRGRFPKRIMRVCLAGKSSSQCGSQRSRASLVKASPPRSPPSRVRLWSRFWGIEAVIRRVEEVTVYQTAHLGVASASAAGTLKASGSAAGTMQQRQRLSGLRSATFELRPGASGGRSTPQSRPSGAATAELLRRRAIIARSREFELVPPRGGSVVESCFGPTQRCHPTSNCATSASTGTLPTAPHRNFAALSTN